jgi:hypothetical protein
VNPPAEIVMPASAADAPAGTARRARLVMRGTRRRKRVPQGRDVGPRAALL